MSNKIKNISIKDDLLLIQTNNGMIYRIDKNKIDYPERAWYDNVISCAESLIWDNEQKFGSMNDRLQNMNQVNEWRSDDDNKSSDGENKYGDVGDEYDH